MSNSGNAQKSYVSSSSWGRCHCWWTLSLGGSDGGEDQVGGDAPTHDQHQHQHHPQHPHNQHHHQHPHHHHHLTDDQGWLSPQVAQREALKDRQSRGEEWQTKLFLHDVIYFYTCFLREGSGYQIGWIFGKKSKRPPPRPHLRKIILQFFSENVRKKPA